MVNVLTLDLGANTGWALSLQGKTLSGTINFKNDRFQGGGMRFLRFRMWLEEIASSVINAVYFEEVRRHLGVDAAHAYGGYLGVLTSWCEERKIPYEGVPVGTIKKFATGKGNASKNEVVNFARECGYQPKDDNEADALALLEYVSAFLLKRPNKKL